MQMSDYWVRKGLKLRTKADVTVQNARTESLYAS